MYVQQNFSVFLSAQDKILPLEKTTTFSTFYSSYRAIQEDRKRIKNRRLATALFLGNRQFAAEDRLAFDALVVGVIEIAVKDSLDELLHLLK